MNRDLDSRISPSQSPAYRGDRYSEHHRCLRSQARKRRNIRRGERRAEDGFEVMLCVVGLFTLGAMMLIGATA